MKSTPVFEIDQYVYFLKRNRICTGQVVGIQATTVKGKYTEDIYLIDCRIPDPLTARQVFNENLKDAIPSKYLYSSMDSLLIQLQYQFNNSRKTDV